MCVALMMSDYQNMIRLQLSLNLNLNVSMVLCNMSFELWAVGVEHTDGRWLWTRSSEGWTEGPRAEKQTMGRYTLKGPKWLREVNSLIKFSTNH